MTISTNGNRSQLPFSEITLTSDTDQDDPNSAASLRARGMVRSSGIIPIELNERFKAMARKQGRNADQFIGELLQKCSLELDRLEAEQEVQRLRERFGDGWLDVLRQADRPEVDQ
jgi:hypothetical protein